MPSSEGSMTRRLIQLDEALIRIEDEMTDHIEEGTDIPEALAERACDFAVEKAANVDRVVEFFHYTESQIAFLEQNAQQAQLQHRRAVDQLKRMKKLLAEKLSERADPKLKGEVTFLRAQSNGQESWHFENPDGVEVGADEIVPVDYCDYELKITAPATMKGDLGPIVQAVQTGDVMIIITCPKDMADAIEPQVRDSVAFEGVRVATLAEADARGSETRTIPNMVRLKQAMNEGVKIPGVSQVRGVHLRYTSIKIKQPAKVAA